ncbi:hypothetical protein [Desulfobacula sp.]|uniref:hypothetical protein n=1 Tax=Desulfobacula sp. TaxID=2593537 RepID=UPI0025C36F70|nr:hypothetical protein [Desulfobacula sp.]
MFFVNFRRFAKNICQRKTKRGKKPRLRIVGISGNDIKLYAKHIRKVELEAIANKSGADIIYLPGHGTGNKDGSRK